MNPPGLLSRDLCTDDAYDRGNDGVHRGCLYGTCSIQDDVGIGCKKTIRTDVAVSMYAARGKVLLGQRDGILVCRRLAGDLAEDHIVAGKIGESIPFLVDIVKRSPV